MLSHIEPYLLMPSSLTPTALLERAEQLVSSSALADALRALGDAPIRVRHTPLYDAWLLPWGLGAATELHTHEGTHGAYAAIRGALRETIASPSAVRERIVGAGERVAYRPGYAHRLASVGDTPAVTLHLSSPPRPNGPCRPAPAGSLALAAH